jgi:hypothetical protein
VAIFHSSSKALGRKPQGLSFQIQLSWKRGCKEIDVLDLIFACLKKYLQCARQLFGLWLI